MPRTLNLHRIPGTGRQDAPSSVPEDEREAMERDMRESLAALDETDEPLTPKRQSRLPERLNLNRAPEREPNAEPTWIGAMVAVLSDAGPTAWLSHSDIMSRMPRDIGLPGRTTSSTKLSELADEGRIRRSGSGNQTRYSTVEASDADA
jgi:hypothetical protein